MVRIQQVCPGIIGDLQQTLQRECDQPQGGRLRADQGKFGIRQGGDAPDGSRGSERGEFDIETGADLRLAKQVRGRSGVRDETVYAVHGNLAE